MRHRIAVLAFAVVLGGLVGCGDSAPPVSTAIPGETTSTSYEAATVFEEWSIPEAACLRIPEDEDLLADEVDRAARRVEQLAARFGSGWPTTTTRPLQEAEALEADMLRGGIQALALAMLADSEDEVRQRWDEYEASYANPASGAGPLWAISSRVNDWVAPAQAVVEAATQACSEL